MWFVMSVILFAVDEISLINLIHLIMCFLFLDFNLI